MKHAGDIRKLSGAELEPVDCVCGGSPCQNFSQAGNRKGLGGDESVLFYQQVRVVKELRENDRATGRTGRFVRPRYMVWENVPGALSSPGGKRKGEDFKAVLEEIVRIAEPNAPDVPMPNKGWPKAGCLYDVDGRWSVAWRVHDAQFWGGTLYDADGVPIKYGTPQRRRRIAVVADFGGRTAPTILFEQHGSGGYFEESGQQRERIAAEIETGVNVNAGENGIEKVAIGFPLGFRPENVREYEEVATTLCNGTRPGFTCGVIEEKWIKKQAGVECVGVLASSAVNAEVTNGEISPCLMARAGTGGNQLPLVAVRIAEQHDEVVTELASGKEVYGTLMASMAEKQCLGDQEVKSGDYHLEERRKGSAEYRARRLTITEMERLQGFPDGWTDIGEWTDGKGKKRKSTDSQRCKALGNSIALPFWKWVLKRISAQYERDATLGSLFDGIGGFPYLWEQINGKDTARWASEIEEFPIAVTKVRFGDR